MMEEETVRGVVDRFEGAYAVVILDDGQQLDWPRSTLPASVQPGMAVVLSLSPATGPRELEGEDQVSAQATDEWGGELTQEAGRWIVRLAGGQVIRWPAGLTMLAQSDNQVSLQLAVDAEDTEARRRRVADLLDDIFGAAE
jgi:hypothetical protein